MEQHLVFVYGSLKQGFHNHNLLKYETYLGKAKTFNKYPLIEETETFPALLERSGWGFQIYGELYEVASITLEKLDKLESHPEYFKRKEIAIEYNNQVVKAFCYFKAEPTDENYQQFFLENWEL